MSGFPKLIPAFPTHIVLNPTIPIGSVSKGGPLTVAPFITPNSYLRSEPGYPIKVNAEFLYGSDFIRADPDGKHLRLNVNSVLKDKSGAVISYRYTGIIDFTAEVARVFGGGAKESTEFGDVFTHISFETGSDELKALEQKVYVGSGRFIVEAGKPLIVEYKISEVAL